MKQKSVPSQVKVITKIFCLERKKIQKAVRNRKKQNNITQLIKYPPL